MPRAKRAKRIKHRGPGRPHVYSEKLADELCEWLSNGKPLTQWCKLPGKPNYSTIMKWLWRDSDYREEFNSKYARAREMQSEFMADEIIEIADDDSGDYIQKVDKKGRVFEAIDHENIQRSRLKVDARKWIMSKMRPKKYGDSTSLKLSGEDDGPLVFEVVYKEGRKDPSEDEKDEKLIIRESSSKSEVKK